MNSPLTEDSGQFSSSFPSTPIKEQSPVHQPGSKGSGHPHRHSGSSHSTKKSDLYGTPHWWPIESSAGPIEHDDMKSSKYSDQIGDEEDDELETETAGAVHPTQPSSTTRKTRQEILDGQNSHQKAMAFVIDFNNDTTDVKSDNGTYTLDEPRQSVDVCNENGGGGSISSGGDPDSWIVKWVNDTAAGQLNSEYEEDRESHYNNNETKEILSETEKIVESMQSRVQRSKSSLSPTSTNTKKYPASMIKFNRAFNIRRTLNTNSNATYDSDNYSNKSNTQGDNGHFSRSDGGRFSLRMSRGDRRNFNSASDPEGHGVTPIRPQRILSSRPSVASESSYRNSSPHPASSSKFTPLKPPISNTTSSLKQQPKSVRSNSTMSSRDIELENWRRRKSYDPMRSSGMACQRLPGGSSSFNASSSESKDATMGSSINPNDPRKNTSSSLTRKKEYLKRSSAKPSNPPPSPTVGGSLTIISKLPQSCCGNSNSRLIETASVYSCGEDHPRVFSDYKTHCQGHLEQRKFEALDTLVISTIHSLSTKVRNLSLNLLKKIQPNHGEDENGALLEEMITQLTELSQSQVCNNTTSKELSGTLKNIKKIEQVVLVLDRVLCDDQGSTSSED